MCDHAAASITDVRQLPAVCMHNIRTTRACTCFRWSAVYKVIPDEQPLIEQTLKDMVQLPVSCCAPHHDGHVLSLDNIACCCSATEMVVA